MAVRGQSISPQCFNRRLHFISGISAFLWPSWEEYGRFHFDFDRKWTFGANRQELQEDESLKSEVEAGQRVLVAKFVPFAM